MTHVYKRKGFIKLKKCFKVLKTQDQYYLLDSFCLSIFFFFRHFSLICPFCFGGASSFFLDYHFFFWFEYALLYLSLSGSFAFWLSHGFFINYWSLKCHLPPVWGVIIFKIFLKKISQDQKGITRGIFILDNERDNKDGLFSFQAQAVKTNKLWPHFV